MLIPLTTGRDDSDLRGCILDSMLASAWNDNENLRS